MRDIGPRIKARREQLGWSATKLATLAGISQSFLWRIEAGKAAGSWESYEKIAGALGISVSVLLPTENIESAVIGWRTIPVLDYVQAGGWTGVLPDAGDDDTREKVMTDLEYPPSTFAMRIKGDSMEPEFKAGDLVVISPTVQPKPGDFVVATNGHGEATFKQFRSAGLNERGIEVFELHPLNPLHAPMRSDRLELAIVGVMVEHRRYRRR